MKRKLLLAALCVVGALGFRANAQSWTSGSEVAAGEFYLYNVAADRYLNFGSSWATHSIVDGQGLVLTISEQGEGYKIYSGVSGGVGPYVWGSWMNDNNGSGYWTFTPVSVDGYTNAYTLQRSSDSEYLVWSGGGSGAWGNEVNSQADVTDKCYWLLIAKDDRTALSSATASNPLDVTYLVNDPDFEKRVSEGTNATPAAGSGQTSTSWTGGFWRQYSAQSFANAIFFEKYASGGLTTADNFYQTVSLSAGVYRLTATAYASCTEAYLYAGDAETRVSASDTYSVFFEVASDATSVNLGMKIKAGGSGQWVAFDNVRLTYYGNSATLNEIKHNEFIKVYNAAKATAEAVDQTAVMNAEILTALQTAISTYGSLDTNTATDDEIQAATTALNTSASNATASIAAYAPVPAVLAKATANLNSTNVYTDEARTALSNAINEAQSAYDGRTLSTADANGLNAKLNNAGWGASPAPLASDYVFSTWTSTNDVAVANFWSTEADADGGSDMKTPFVQYWVADGDKLSNNTITGTTTVETGLYRVTALVRVVNKKTGDDAGYDGISLQVNDGEAVAFADATEYPDGYAKEITAEGLVKDGNLYIKLAVENTNASWLAFKNVNYTKVRDLTAEEQATAPTAIALYNGEEEVTETIALDVTTQTVTLTPNYTPADATEGYISWVSSDETVATVANGVVTAVGTGAATITATSTLAPSVSATADVTVSFPESTVPTYVNDGATRTVYNYGENLIKNGSFEYPDPYYGWTSGTQAKLTSDNFNIIGEAGSQSLQATSSQGAGNVESISTAWKIEANKTYQFGYNVKPSKAGTAEFYVVSLTNTVGTETKQLDTANDRKGIAVSTTGKDIVYTFTNTEGYQYIQFRARWLADSQCFDNFYLCEVLGEPTTEGNVDYATAAIPTANIGTGAFQVAQTAIDAANALVQGTATVAEVEAAYDALTTLNAPAEGQLFNIINVSTGYTPAGKAITFKSASNADLSGNTTAMGWTEAVGSDYPQAVKFTPVEDVTNGYKLSYTRADGNEVFIGTGSKTGLGNATTQIRPTTDAEKALTVQVSYDTDKDVFYLYNTEAGYRLGGNGANDAGLFTGEANGLQYYSMKIQEAAKASYDLTIDAANQWATIIVPIAIDELPEDLYAYTVEVNGEVLEYTKVTALEAYKPYVIYAEEGFNDAIEGYGAAYTDNADVTGENGNLVGVLKKAETLPADAYVLQNNDDVVGFYKAVTGNFVDANHAYLVAPASASIKAFVLGENADATAIKGFEVLTSGAYDAIYNAAGAKVGSVQKGLNIVVKGDKSYKIFVK